MFLSVFNNNTLEYPQRSVLKSADVYQQIKTKAFHVFSLKEICNYEINNCNLINEYRNISSDNSENQTK